MGRVTESRLSRRRCSGAQAELEHGPEIHNFNEIYFDALQPNEPMIALMREIGPTGDGGWRC